MCKLTCSSQPLVTAALPRSSCPLRQLTAGCAPSTFKPTTCIGTQSTAAVSVREWYHTAGVSMCLPTNHEWGAIRRRAQRSYRCSQPSFTPSPATTSRCSSPQPHPAKCAPSCLCDMRNHCSRGTARAFSFAGGGGCLLSCCPCSAASRPSTLAKINYCRNSVSELKKGGSSLRVFLCVAVSHSFESPLPPPPPPPPPPAPPPPLSSSSFVHLFRAAGCLYCGRLEEKVVFCS